MNVTTIDQVTSKSLHRGAPVADDKEYLSVPEAASELGVSPSTIRRWIKAGHFPGAGRKYRWITYSDFRIPKDEVEKKKKQMLGG